MATALQIRVDRRVQQKGVDAAIPSQVDEADQASVGVGADVGEAMPQLAGKVDPGMLGPGRGEQGVQFQIGDRGTALVRHLRGAGAVRGHGDSSAWLHPGYDAGVVLREDSTDRRPVAIPAAACLPGSPWHRAALFRRSIRCCTLALSPPRCPFPRSASVKSRPWVPQQFPPGRCRCVKSQPLVHPTHEGRIRMNATAYGGAVHARRCGSGPGRRCAPAPWAAHEAATPTLARDRPSNGREESGATTPALWL